METDVTSKVHYLKVGNPDNTNIRHQRIIHISDTHNEHDDFLKANLIPAGDILIHSGDFSKQQIARHQDLRTFIGPVENFFRDMPHKYKVFVPGNHDYSLENHPDTEIQGLLPSAIYVHDREITIEGLRIYGTGWTRLRESSQARAFALPPDELSPCWEKITPGVDILVSHSPPYGILDHDNADETPPVTGCTPRDKCTHGHLGCMHLYLAVLNRIRPKLNLVGHSHYGNGVVWHDGIAFSNAAMEKVPSPVIIDLFYPDKTGPSTSEENKHSVVSAKY